MSLTKPKRKVTGKTSPQRSLVLMRAEPKPMSVAPELVLKRRKGSVSCDENAPTAAEPFAVPISYHLSHDLLEKMQTDNCRKKTSLISFTSFENI